MCEIMIELYKLFESGKSCRPANRVFGGSSGSSQGFQRDIIRRHEQYHQPLEKRFSENQ